MSEPLIGPLERLGLEVERMALAAEQPAPRRRRRRRRVPVVLGLRPGIVIALVVLLLLAAAAATGLLIRHHASGHPSGSGPGRVLPSTVRLAALRVPDPAGGPPWGIRTLRTSARDGCVQVGRVVNGQLGVLGRDGAFGNDGRFHPLPPDRLQQTHCRPLDAAGNLLVAVSSMDAAAGAEEGSCLARRRPSCPPADLRDVTFGTLGPRGRSIDYADPRTGAVRTQQADGPDHAFLVVGRPDGSHPAVTGVIVQRTPSAGMKAVHYDDGTTCRIRPVHLPPGVPAGEPDQARPCPAAGLAATLAHPTTLRTPITATHGPAATPPGGGPPARPVHISFRAPLATPDASEYYVVYAQLFRRNVKACGVRSLVQPVTRPVAAAGDRVTATLWVNARCTLRTILFTVRLHVVTVDDPDARPYAGGRTPKGNAYLGSATLP